MKWITNAFGSSVGRKIMVSLTGLFLITFLTVHLIGNLLLIVSGAEAFNAFAHFMAENPVVRIPEIFLGLGFLFHIYNTIVLTWQNYKARPIKYKLDKRNKNSNIMSRTMIWSGSIILMFLIIHVANFFVAHRVTHGDIESMQGISFFTGGNMAESVTAAFQNPVYVGLYLFAMLLLIFHLLHGFQSAFQTLGLSHVKYNKMIKGLGYLIAALFPMGFAVIPIVIYLSNN